MEVGSVVGVIGVVLVVLLALGVLKGRVKNVLDGLAALSFVYSSLELFRCIVEYVRWTRTPFPSVFHVELVVVAFGPLYVLARAMVMALSKLDADK